MSYLDNMMSIINELRRVNIDVTVTDYSKTKIKNKDIIKKCKILSCINGYTIFYVEDKSNYFSLGTEIVKKHKDVCLIFTKYDNLRYIVSTVPKDGGRKNYRHVVLDANINSEMLANFIRELGIKKDDQKNIINEKVQCVFDKYTNYDKAIKAFGTNLSEIILTIRNDIKEKIVLDKKNGGKYEQKSNKLLNMCKKTINENITTDDVAEMLLQHILTYRIFELVYDERKFHQKNTIAKSLNSLKNTLKIKDEQIDYKSIEIIAESITDHDKRQEFLKNIYETFYKEYDPSKAKNDGIVYTPSEIVNFMVRVTDELLKKYFNVKISDDGITILDPATGTGTFPISILRHIAKNDDKDKTTLRRKYEKDILANEISILPYYIAALNIEKTYHELVGRYAEFKNICWMDTLDKGIEYKHKIPSHIQKNTNVKRITKQQQSEICVVIGNPPYNAHQTSVNDDDPNKKYEDIDSEIQRKYSDESNVRNKNTSIDMYKRFLLWSSKRIDKKGMVVFISNNSFLDAKSDDGVRRGLYKEFDQIYTVNLKGNLRYSGEDVKKEGENVFNILVGVAITFFIKTEKQTEKITKTNGKLWCAEIPDGLKQKEKLEWLDENSLTTMKFKNIKPTKDAVWMNQTHNNFNKLLPVISTEFNESIFKMYTSGSKSNKDEWAYSLDRSKLEKNMKKYISIYNNSLVEYKKQKPISNIRKWLPATIKWSDKTIQCLKKDMENKYSDSKIKPTLYRPFVIKYQYYDNIITERKRKFDEIFKNSQMNKLIAFSNPKTRVIFTALATDIINDEALLDGTQSIPFWKNDVENNDQEQKTSYKCKRNSNITEYARNIFKKQYDDQEIDDENIFYYVYGMFNDPKYKQKYANNLKRKLPRIPLAKNFKEYATLGKTLFEMHSGFNNAHEYNLRRLDDKKEVNKIILKINSKANEIIIDDKTKLTEIPIEVFEYLFESKSPLKWILDAYREFKIKKDNTKKSIEKSDEELDISKFLEHKEELIVLLKKVTTVCINTVKIHEQLKKQEWGAQPTLTFTKQIKKSKKWSEKNKLDDLPSIETSLDKKSPKKKSSSIKITKKTLKENQKKNKKLYDS